LNEKVVKLLRDQVIPPRFLPLAHRIYYSQQRASRLLADWTIPPAYQRIISEMLFRRALRPTARESAILLRNAKFRNMYAGRRCFVIGNGPSLSKQDLSPLENEITIAMNSFNRHPIIEKWQPTFFCMAEPTETLTPEQLALELKNIAAQAHFFRIEHKERFDKYRYLDPENVYYLKTSLSLCDWPKWDRYSFDFSKTIPGFQNTSLMAIAIALYIGCSPIYLVGLDHDWLAERNVSTHFYTTTPGDIRHADLSDWSYRKLVEMVLVVWSSHERLRDLADRMRVTIYNATGGGYLDVYPRVEFNSLFLSRSKLGEEIK